MRSKSLGLVKIKFVRQKGCSSQEPQSSFRCIPTRKSVVLILTSIFFFYVKLNGLQSAFVFPNWQRKNTPRTKLPTTGRKLAANVK
jgi:hypothetical protein